MLNLSCSPGRLSTLPPPLLSDYEDCIAAIAIRAEYIVDPIIATSKHPSFTSRTPCHRALLQGM